MAGAAWLAELGAVVAGAEAVEAASAEASGALAGAVGSRAAGREGTSSGLATCGRAVRGRGHRVAWVAARSCCTGRQRALSPLLNGSERTSATTATMCIPI